LLHSIVNERCRWVEPENNGVAKQSATQPCDGGAEPCTYSKVEKAVSDEQKTQRDKKKWPETFRAGVNNRCHSVLMPPNDPKLSHGAKNRKREFVCV